ncbi:tudor domain-containing protein 3 [Elysia marginata]|uniref:Tudor domain-containing protein 3 n=1 Tax=Elysia marginata TaxID=1093978 RepID=A0AAV4HGZ9_9GAST|nr:tudor domain-containing protein 3 [Elysia marginata]
MNKFYPAVVENVHQAGSTVVVTFIEYGNQEEVLTQDLMPFQQQGWPFEIPTHMYNMSGGVDPSLQDPGYSAGPAFVPPMEFTRGGNIYQGGGGGRRRPDSDRRKPTQKYYVAPSQKHH